MKILDGKNVAQNIQSTFEKRLQNLKIKPNIAVLGLKGNDASGVYIKTIEKNCEKYGIGFNLIMANTEEEFRKNFESVKNHQNITGIIVQRPLPQQLIDLVNEIPLKKDIEGRLEPCTSRAVIETLDYYGIEIEGKKVVVVGKSDIVGKPLAVQLLDRDATVTVCHTKTQNLSEETNRADIVVMAIGEAEFLKKEYIKQGVILIDVGINFKDGKIVGDIDFEDIKEKAKACTPVPGGIGTVTNAVLIDNIIKGCE